MKMAFFLEKAKLLDFKLLKAFSQVKTGICGKKLFSRKNKADFDETLYEAIEA